ncbi:MAG: AsnC family transcriptional regulator [Desulfobacteraceae bacterium]|jgi:siroheme decarboxylase|nr:AsnC family transcriptional regulator [Desulfobacteraceae bacterium]MDH3572104.1 AsnC family transcriptional regulator [Desulfobacteraceae bacterium]MDH3720805.1 AsnC family transcriptional regulator [Desulfobacteraceae bacterium]MDH3835167.1 AsnC family transcriptional regulator [Desulfobacteraceae bacterium]MDH3872537.1 AsnC family transcriptional regulator [Desulfobacteraceae bacterium]
MPSIDEIDRAILNRIQSDFPITTRPYLSIAENLNLSEDQVIKRLKRLKKKGIIRRIGGNFAPEKLGFVSTLCAAKVSRDKIDHFARAVNRYPGVTHNYRRDNKYNIWFTFIAQSMDEIKNNLENISQETGVKRIINLPATKMYKIKAHFDL